MVKTNLLKAKMVEKGINQIKLAEKLKLSMPTINVKLNGGRDFTLNEVKSLVSILELDEQTIQEIFFN